MSVDFFIPTTYLIGAAVYLVVGLIGVLIHQSVCADNDRFGFAGCLFWIVFWLPALVIAIFFKSAPIIWF